MRTLRKSSRRSSRVPIGSGIGVHDSPAVDVDDGRVGDGGRIADDRLQQRVQAGIALERLVQDCSDLPGIALVNKRAAEIDLGGFASALPDFLGYKVGAIVGLRGALSHQMRHVKVREQGHQGKDHAADCQHQLCF